MKRHELLARLMRGIGEDLRDYRSLQALLEEQFVAALRHRSARLMELAQQIAAIVELIEARRRERLALAAALAGTQAPMSAVLDRLPETQRTTAASGWRSLEALVRRCKELNQRNCALMTAQQDIMQRVMHGDEATYAPA